GDRPLGLHVLDETLLNGRLVLPVRPLHAAMHLVQKALLDQGQDIPPDRLGRNLEIRRELRQAAGSPPPNRVENGMPAAAELLLMPFGDDRRGKRNRRRFQREPPKALVRGRILSRPVGRVYGIFLAVSEFGVANLWSLRL